MPWWAETISVVTRRLFKAEFSRILANSQEFTPANENEQNRFLTLGAVEILISNGVYKEKLHFSSQVVRLTSSKLYIRNYELRILRISRIT